MATFATMPPQAATLQPIFSAEGQWSSAPAGRALPGTGLQSLGPDAAGRPLMGRESSSGTPSQADAKYLGAGISRQALDSYEMAKRTMPQGEQLNISNVRVEPVRSASYLAPVQPVAVAAAPMQPAMAMAPMQSFPAMPMMVQQPVPMMVQQPAMVQQVQVMPVPQQQAQVLPQQQVQVADQKMTPVSYVDKGSFMNVNDWEFPYHSPAYGTNWRCHYPDSLDVEWNDSATFQRDAFQDMAHDFFMRQHEQECDRAHGRWVGCEVLEAGDFVTYDGREGQLYWVSRESHDVKIRWSHDSKDGRSFAGDISGLIHAENVRPIWRQDAQARPPVNRRVREPQPE